MVELDVLLLRYLRQRWPEADVGERADFERLLMLEDDLLWRWCLGREVASDPGLAKLLERLLALPA